MEGVVFATCISAAVATLVMGLYANYPIALAPGMSLNAYFTYSVVWHARSVADGAGRGLLFRCPFLILTVTRVREQIVNGIPDCLKHSPRPALECLLLSWPAQCETCSRQPGHFCRPRQLC